MTRVAVTGSAGRAGRAIVADLLEHGHDVTAIDVAAADDAPGADHVRLDLADFGALEAAVAGCEALVHMAADPRPDTDVREAVDRFDGNTTIAYHAFLAAVSQGIERVVWASSETVQGLPFDEVLPPSAPLDEASPLLPRTGYAMSKAITEDLARHMHARHGTTFIGLRFSNILTVGHPTAGYDAVPSYWQDPRRRAFNLWSYVDSRDVAGAVRAALEADVAGAEVLIVAAADTIMRQPSAELVGEVFPGLVLRPGTGPHESLLSSRRAREVIGYVPRHSWRDVLGEPV